MNSHASTQTSNLDRVLAASLATFSMFVVGYSATRVFLGQPNSLAGSNLMPHQAELWRGLGR